MSRLILLLKRFINEVDKETLQLKSDEIPAALGEGIKKLRRTILLLIAQERKHSGIMEKKKYQNSVSVKTALEIMFNDLNDIYEGTDEEVRQELAEMGVDLEAANTRFKLLLKSLRGKKEG